MRAEELNEEAEKNAGLHSDADFRSEVIYFIVVDRFHSASNNDRLKEDELTDLTHQDWNKYWGGTLDGIYAKLDYLQETGVTALWLTPLFEQVEALELATGRAANHGYWARDFQRINCRLIDNVEECALADTTEGCFDRLVAELHRRGMKLILDVVCNHSSPRTKEGKGKIYADKKLIADFDNDADGWYHHYGLITDWDDDWQVKHCEVAGLATFNEENAAFHKYVKDAIKLWIDKGVDALRLDTVKHMPLWFWQEFTADMQLHRPDLFMYGEWINSHPGDEHAVEFANNSGMSILDFGLSNAIRGCFGDSASKGFPLIQAVLDQDHKYRNATELITFFNNHDTPRLQSLNDDDAVQDVALVLLLTTRGIPCIFYGCEQYLHCDKDGGEDPYNRPYMSRWKMTPARRIIRALGDERKKNTALQWGGHWPLLVEKDVYVYLRKYRESRCLVVLNRGEAKSFTLRNLDFPGGKYACLLGGGEIEISDGHCKIEIGRKQGAVYSVSESKPHTSGSVRFQLNAPRELCSHEIGVIGSGATLGDWDPARMVMMEKINPSTWFIDVTLEDVSVDMLSYKYVAREKGINGHVLRENRVARRRYVKPGASVKLRDVWRH